MQGRLDVMTDTSIRDYYDERYTSEGGDTFPHDPSRYRAWFGSLLAAPQSVSRMLDFGCGAGYVCSLFAELGYDVTGVEISRAALEIARRREPRATFIEAPAGGALPFDDASFDVIVCLGVLEHIPEPPPVVAALRRVARKDATAVWVVPNARSPFFWFGHGTGQIEEHPRSLDGWRELLASGGWVIVDVRRDPGPIDRPIAGWKRLGQGILNRLPKAFTYQFVLETQAR
jgi:SAM-dependent methyltransferase